MYFAYVHPTHSTLSSRPLSRKILRDPHASPSRRRAAESVAETTWRTRKSKKRRRSPRRSSLFWTTTSTIVPRRSASKQGRRNELVIPRECTRCVACRCESSRNADITIFCSTKMPLLPLRRCIGREKSRRVNSRAAAACCFRANYPELIKRLPLRPIPQLVHLTSLVLLPRIHPHRILATATTSNRARSVKGARGSRKRASSSLTTRERREGRRRRRRGASRKTKEERAERRAAKREKAASRKDRKEKRRAAKVE